MSVPPASAADPAAQRQQRARVGVVYGVLAYGAWGLVPIYFRAVSTAPALEVLMHRVAWSVVLLALLMFLRKQWGVAREALRHRRTILTLLLTSVLIAINWYVFIWSVEHERVLEASLGYFINPLVNVLLGFVFLRERLRRLQLLGLALAALGVAAQTYLVGSLPVVSLILATSFGMYGLLRKTARVESLVGLTMETTVLLPIALAYLIWVGARGEGMFLTQSWPMDALLVFAGVVTAVPLLWFAAAARRIQLTTMGFLQYLAPTGHLFCALYYGESLAWQRLLAFGFIWIALVVYSIDAAMNRPGRRARKGEAPLMD
ncbi:MAG: EamA family transporter RarD [Phycisphaerales bacterium JB038]